MLRTLADSIGGGVEFTASNGKTYKIRRLTMADMANFEGWLEGRAYAVVQKLQGKVPAEVLGPIATQVATDIASGKYAFGGPACNAALAAMAGQVKLLSIFCDIPEEEAIQLAQSDPGAIGAAMKMMVDRSMPETEEGNGKGA